MIICAKRTLSEPSDQRIPQVEVNIVKSKSKTKMLNKRTISKTMHDTFTTIEAPRAVISV